MKTLSQDIENIIIKPDLESLKDLSEEEYNGIPLSLHDMITNHTQREEKKWYNVEKPILPKYTKPQIKRSVGMWNFINNILREVRI